MHRRLARLLALSSCLPLLAALAFAPCALAGEQPWRDRDPTARAPQQLDMRSPRVLEKIEQAMLALPKHPAPLMQYGFAQAVAGNGGPARAAYADVLAMVKAPGVRHSDLLERHVRWSYGWALSLLDDHDGAIDQWQQSRALHGGQPFWFPYSSALVHWKAGRQGEALTWYTAAVEAYPNDWGTPEGVARRTRYWQPVQKAAMQELFEAWSHAPRGVAP